MEPMRFERDVLDQTDEELGASLIAYWLSINAVRAGINGPEVPKEFAVTLIDETAKRDGGSVEFAALQSIYRKACRGHLAAAGRMFREWVEHNERQFDLQKHAEASLRLAEGRKKGGKKGGETRRSEAASGWQRVCVAHARRLLAQGTDERDLVGRLSKTINRSGRRIRDVLKEAGVLKGRK